jgi:hypothetical protein
VLLSVSVAQGIGFIPLRRKASAKLLRMAPLELRTKMSGNVHMGPPCPRFVGQCREQVMVQLAEGRLGKSDKELNPL